MAGNKQTRPKTFKQPHYALNPNPKKEPKIQNLPKYKGGCLAWRFSNADRDGPFSWDKLEDKEYREVMQALHQFEGMDETSIGQQGSHVIPVQSLSKEARRRLQEIKKDDIDDIMSFRLGGRKRVFCIPLITNKNIMLILWWDPEHKVCLSEKKHT